MLFQEIIASKRDGRILTADEIAYFVAGCTDGTIPDYQIAALLMAIYLRGMDDSETAALTDAMANSGGQIDLVAALPPGHPTLDKHSTGGVGDKTSLILVPMLAAAGIAICKMSGRGLGHTGGTLDKLESVPGFKVERSIDQMLEQVASIGACLVGQSAELAPADKKLYALRDATATVGSLPLIVASILSKKLAGGAGSFLFDVKVGGGALLPSLEEARALANALVRGGQRHGKATVAVLSDMNQPLGRAIGNALEVAEAIHLLTPTENPNRDSHKSSSETRLRELCLTLATQGILLSGILPVADESNAYAHAEEVLTSGAALAVFRKIVAAQGGDPTVVDSPETLPAAPVIREVTAPQNGFIREIAATTLGNIVVRLGGGRERKEDLIDPAVGLELHHSVSAWVRQGEPLVRIHAQSEEQAANLREDILSAFRFSLVPVDIPPLILETVTGEERIPSGLQKSEAGKKES